MRARRRTIATATASMVAFAFLLASGDVFGQPAAGAPLREHPFELGVFAGAHIYDKDHGLGRYNDDPYDLSPESGLAFGLRASWSIIPNLALEGEIMLSPTSTRDDATPMVVLGYRANLVVNLLTQGRWRPFALAGGGALSSFTDNTSRVENDTDGFFHLGLGAKYRVNDRLGLRLEGRVLAPPAIASDIASSGDETMFGGPDYEVLASLYFALGGAAASPPPPPPPVDLDPDRDGVLGAADKCPQVPEDKDGFQDEDGCPDLDNDGDGLPDLKDRCPNDAEDKDGFQDEDGCPDPDNDGDAIPDVRDKCPNDAEIKNGYQDEDGCPDEVPPAVKKFTGVVEGINFQTDKATILRGSFVVLNRAVQVMKDYPEVRFEISGHTDNVGKAEYNKGLSERRAQAVMKYMVDKGIAAERLTAVGFGLERPIADNKVAAGRAKNRRTEFRLVSGPTVDAPPQD